MEKRLLKLLLIVIMGLFGWFVIGPLLAFLTEDLPLHLLFLGIVLTLLAIPIGYILNVILHEAGHLVFGKLSGYRFVSFRVLNRMLVREKGKLVRKKFTVVGTLGQCLMSPPEPKNGVFPLFAYNLGGAVFNFLFAAICVWLFFLLPAPWRAPFFVMALLGVLLGLISGIPLRVGGLPNDGYNAWLLGRAENAKTRRAFWVQLRANALLTNGTRARDLPVDFFDGAEIAQLDDPLLASTAFLRYNYLLDRQELDAARAFAEALLDPAAKLPNHMKTELRCEHLFFELIKECRPEEIDRLYTEELKAYIRASFIYASRQRLLYAYAKLFTKDAAAAEWHLALFREACTNSASLGEIPGEQELISLVDRIADQREADLPR